MPLMRRRRLGFSLFELMVALGLGLLILRVLSLVVIPLSREVMRGFEEIDMARTAQTLTSSWARDLTRTPPEARNLAGPTTWLLRPLEDRLADGHRAFTPGVVFYQLAGSVLTRREVPAPSVPTLPPSSDWPGLLVAGHPRRLAFGVESLECQVVGGTVTVRAQLRRTVGGRQLGYLWQETFAGRNQ